MARRIRRTPGSGLAGSEGFTLIELLVVIIIIAILAAIAIPTFLGQRQKAHDAAAKSLVRNAMTAVESAYVDDRDFSAVTAAELKAIEPSLTFSVADNAGTSPSAQASANAVDYKGGSATTYEIGTVSQSGKKFGVKVDRGENGGTTYWVDGVQKGW
jgi:type IV pilus assembly protein PilA